jgi:hypothetical protein
MSQDKRSYLGNPQVKRDGVDEEWTPEKVDEYRKCMEDPKYFAKNYVKVISLNEGLTSFDLYDYQERMFDHFTDNRFSVVLACRQSGKSISSVVWILWFAIFHPDKNIAVLANKGATAREMLGRVTLALENLPFFLQPGCKVLNKGSIEFSNNSKIFASATSSSSVRGQSADVIFLDEFAFVNRAEEFYTSTYPVISSGQNSKVIITSTANGVGNLFHKIWEGAVQGTNEYKPFRIDWWDVPGRDEEWRRQTIANTSEIQFKQEFSNQFVNTSDTLIASDKLLGLQSENPIYQQDNVRVFDRPDKDSEYMMFVDVAKGRGLDYSTFTIIDITSKPFKQVAVYQDNMVSPLLFPDIIYKYAKTYNDAYVIIESNDAGQVVCNGLYYELEYENVFVESSIKANSIGVNMTRKIKRIGCSNLKDLIEEGQLLIRDSATIVELSTFTAQGQSFAASDGNHDDLVMNLVLFGWFATTQLFAEFTDIDVRKMIYEEQIKMIEDDMVPFGEIDDGLDDRIEVIDGDVWTTGDDPQFGAF